jgi:hypothetical protein
MPDQAARVADRQQFLTDVLVTALEGGISYWAYTTAYRWYYPDLAGGTAEPGPGDTANAWAHVVIEDDGDGDPSDRGADKHTIDLELISRGLGRIAGSTPIEHLGEVTRRSVRYCNRVNDLAPDQAPSYVVDIDADIADQIVQVGLFGRVVYG